MNHKFIDKLILILKKHFPTSNFLIEIKKKQGKNKDHQVILQANLHQVDAIRVRILENLINQIKLLNKLIYITILLLILLNKTQLKVVFFMLNYKLI